MVTMIVKVKNKFGANLKAPNSPPRSEERDEEEEEQQEEEEEEEEETEEEEEDEEEQEEEEERGGYLRSGSGSSPSPVPYFHQTRVSMDAAESTPGSPSSSSGGIFQFDPSRMSSIIKRRAMIKELTACYRAKCISHCQNLVELQSQWRQDLEDSHVQQYGLQYHGNNQNCMFEATHTPPQRVKQTSSTVSASNDEAASAELLENSTSASQSPLRKHLTWRSNEREALRRGLMMFGLGRSDKVRSVMSGILKKMRHGLGDIADCCWEFVRICAMHVDEKERMLAERLYEKSKDLEIESGPEVSSRIGSWDRVEKSASGWLKRLILLDSLANVIRLCASKETQEAAYSAIASLKDGTSPFEWWGREADLALLSGVYKHGFGNYEALRRDPQFTGAFQPFSQKGDAKAFMEVESFQHSYEFGESQYKDRFHSEDDLENVDSREGSHFSWPDANTLTRRLKRLIEHIGRIEKEFDVTGKHIKEKPARVWNKKEKTELYKLLMTWGRPLVMGDDANSHWQTVKNQANNGLLKTRNASSIESGIRSIELDMRQILANPNNIEEKDCTNFVEPAFVSGPKFLSGKTAIRLKERIELLDTLRQAVDVLPDDWGHLGSLLNQRNNMPAWWQTCQHDRALVKGVLRHGCGNWDAIFEDDSLFAIPGGFSENDNLPDPKTCMKRLRFIGCHLRRHMKKLKGRRKRSMTDDKENDISNEPRRFKRVRSAEIQRNSDGKPILPLVLTERLTVLDLGTIEYRRPGFHTDRHVFPIGYTSLRNYASMTDKDGRTNYTCEVLDGGTGPVFRVVPEDSPDIVIEKDSASGAWAVVCTAGNKIRGIERGKITISGTEMFGLSHPIICQLLSELPGAEYCSTFAGHSNSGAQIQKQLIKNPVVSAPQDDSEGRNVEINQRDNDTDESESSSDSTDDTDTTDPSDDTDESYEGIAQCRMPEDQNFTSRKMVAHLGSRERTYLDINADPEDFGSS